MAKKIIVGAFGVITFLGLSSAAGYGLLRFRDNARKPISVASTASSSTQSPSNSSEESVLGVTNGNSRSLQGGGLSTQSQNAQNNQSQSALPEPNQFEVYEQYANNESAAYVDVVVGNGLEAKQNTKLAIVYKGWLTNGQLFDQTRADETGKLQPLIFTIGAREVVPGFEQATYGMKVGGKRRLIIPSKLAYGESGQGAIPPNSLLIFDVELVDALDMQTGL